jgi:hypothetical protein
MARLFSILNLVEVVCLASSVVGPLQQLLKPFPS